MTTADSPDWDGQGFPEIVSACANSMFLSCNQAFAMYTGLTLCFAGLGIAIDKPWLLILLVPTVIIVQQLLIRPEERYLEAKFGEEFVHYKNTVRRWL